MRYGQLVVGPAGSGKSTYIANVFEQLSIIKRSSVFTINLDPAAEHMPYQPDVDIRELIKIDDVMEDEEFDFGPNGSLIFCMEFLYDNLEWLDEKLDDSFDEDYIIIDCPGQLELYTHLDVVKKILDHLKNKLEFNICAVYAMDVQFLLESNKFVGGMLSSLAALVLLQMPQVNVLTKVDLLSAHQKEILTEMLSTSASELVSDLESQNKINYNRILLKLSNLIDEYSMISFVPLDYSDDDSLAQVLFVVDSAIQYGENAEVKTRNFDASDCVE